MNKLYLFLGCARRGNGNLKVSGHYRTGLLFIAAIIDQYKQLSVSPNTRDIVSKIR